MNLSVMALRNWRKNFRQVVEEDHFELTRETFELGKNNRSNVWLMSGLAHGRLLLMRWLTNGEKVSGLVSIQMVGILNI